ncbi:MAG: DUF305 domain-containing protein [Methylotenera sp.]|nr:DUF305 domain-containing protein [Flavobacterium sp.]
MIKSRYFKGQTFENKEELFKEMKDNLDLIIASKTAKIQKSCDKGLGIKCKKIDLSKYQEQNKELVIEDTFYYIAVNSTRILDSHDDVHDNGIWSRTIEQIKGKNYLVADHKLETLSTIVRKENIEIFTAVVPFSAIGKDYEGDTEVLIYKFPKDKVLIKSIKEWLDSGDEIQASVRMQYVKMIACFDSADPDCAKEKVNYDKYIGVIANKEDFDYIPYFFLVQEAKNCKESSLVLFGSNGSTGQMKSVKKSMNSNKNIDFIDMMIPHHEKAIKMVNDFDGKITNNELKALMTVIKKSQTKEIETMTNIKNEINSDPSKGTRGDKGIDPLKGTQPATKKKVFIN